MPKEAKIGGTVVGKGETKVTMNGGKNGKGRAETNGTKKAPKALTYSQIRWIGELLCVIVHILCH